MFWIQNFPVRGILRFIDFYWLYTFFHEQGRSIRRTFSTRASHLEQCLASVQSQIHITLQLVLYQFFTTIDTFWRNQSIMVITVGDTMLTRPTALKKYCLSTKVNTVWYYLFVFELWWSITSQAFNYLIASLPD